MKYPPPPPWYELPHSQDYFFMVYIETEKKSIARQCIASSSSFLRIVVPSRHCYSLQIRLCNSELHGPIWNPKNICTSTQHVFLNYKVSRIQRSLLSQTVSVVYSILPKFLKLKKRDNLKKKLNQNLWQLCKTLLLRDRGVAPTIKTGLTGLTNVSTVSILHTTTQ